MADLWLEGASSKAIRLLDFMNIYRGKMR